MTDKVDEALEGALDEAMRDAHISIMPVGGRQLRVATWRLDQPSEHLPLLFFNGIGANIEAVAPLAEALPERPFIMFDMPGIGGSPQPVVPYNPVTMSWTTTQLLDKLGVDTVDVMGVSWGGAMAQHFAIQHPGRTRKLILAATTPGMIMVPGNPSSLSKMADPRRYIDAAFMEEHFQTLYGGALGKAVNKMEHIHRLKPPSPRGYFYQLLAMIGWTSAPVLPFMRKETLILMGDEDHIVPLTNGWLLDKLIPNSELVVLRGGGHLFLLSHSDECVAEIHRFLDESEQSGLSEAA
ncbi:poly(3-hydroxyalkanoate) depolymerase [Altererythrobacter xiamenensis]|uniref:Poly(3-hydroxyalkanoate) depolymerase n=1 Tax=Altererythrobacter xiamenensis TaxID=1316679 RepID=A0A1Y6FJ70_9SPHN|nr:alpha/beta fold hydrolase [Altererythrobacter xiamenensis]SMQ74759.1 poly(3-hydroxyalkanoate) depolymerase [Altererythrobacter xiamenensis]